MGCLKKLSATHGWHQKQDQNLIFGELLGLPQECPPITMMSFQELGTRVYPNGQADFSKDSHPSLLEKLPQIELPK